MSNDAVSTSDDRQPYHRVNGKLMTQREWREKVRLATEVLDAFKRSAFLAHEL
jgi:hypothetical protein